MRDLFRLPFTSWSVSVLLFLMIGAMRADAGTVVSGAVSGTWNLAGSPYWVEGDLQVLPTTTLTVEPGVEVRFRGPYRLSVIGTLRAVGTVVDSILFTRDQPMAAMDWRGIRMVGANDASTLEYCRIEHVTASTVYPDVRGGGVYCESCAPTIRSCLLQHNDSHNQNSNGMGGGVACIEASPLIEDCVMRYNRADSGGGVAVLEVCAPIIRGNLIHDNQAPYAGGGIYAGVRSSAVIENNVIRDNSAGGWGGGGITLWNWYAVYPYSKTVRNNIVAGNTTSAAGGGFYVRYDYSVMENNTIVDNTAALGGGVYVLNQGEGDFPPDLYGFILWGNSAPQGPAIHLEGSTSSAVHVRYCDVEGGWAGTGVINQVPQFADASYHLAPQSPCVDAGNPAVPFNDVCFPPSQGGVRNDMGAYGGPGACDWDEQTADVPDDDGPGHDGSGPDDDGPGPGHDGSGPDDDAPGSSYGGLAVAWSVPVVVTAAVLPVTVQWDSAHAGMPARLDVLDIAGRSVGVSWQGRAGEPSEITLEVQRLPRGVYFARLAIGSRQSARRFVLMN